MSDLPNLKKVSRPQLNQFVYSIFVKSGDSFIVKVAEQSGNIYRVVFQKDYFELQNDANEASKSQWNSLKKRMKRHNHNVFILKEHGTLIEKGAECYYIDFGFFAD